MGRLRIPSRLVLPTNTRNRLTVPGRTPYKRESPTRSLTLHNKVSWQVVRDDGRVVDRGEGENLVTSLGLYLALSYAFWLADQFGDYAPSFVDSMGNTFPSLMSSNYYTPNSQWLLAYSAPSLVPTTTQAAITIGADTATYGRTSTAPAASVGAVPTLNSNNFSMASPSGPVLSMVIPGPCTFYGVGMLPTNNANQYYVYGSGAALPQTFSVESVAMSSGYSYGMSTWYAPASPIVVAEYTALSFQYTFDFNV